MQIYASKKRFPLQVYLLNTPQVRWAGRSLQIPRRQTRGLIFLLASLLRPFPREQLCYLFWENSPEAVARRNLTRLLTHLRLELPDPELLLTYDDEVTLDPQRVWSDTVHFEQLCNTQDPFHRYNAIHEAVELYQRPFLYGFTIPNNSEFDNWTSQRRRTCEQMCLKVLEELLESCTRQGDFLKAIEYARRYLTIDELAEHIHRRLIELYQSSGNRSAALRQFEICTTILERELGVQPMDETRQVYQAVLRGERSWSVASPPQPAWSTLPGLNLPLIGREDALEELKQAYQACLQNRGRIVLISGEAGIGKSRLVEDFAARLQDNAMILASSGSPEGQTMPYQVIIEALRPVLRAAPLTMELPPAWLSEASHLFPELCNYYPDLPSPAPGPSELVRSRIWESLRQMLFSLASGPLPLVLFLDNLQWVDSTTLDWLVYLGRQLKQPLSPWRPPLIVAAYNPYQGQSLEQLRLHLQREAVIHEIVLPGLERQHILEILSYYVDSAEHVFEFAGRLQQATGGNPFFITEILRAMLETGQFEGDLGKLRDLPLPASVQHAINMRLSQLSAMARQVLEASSVLKPGFVLDLVQHTAGRQAIETLNVLEELTARNLLVEQEGRFSFHHHLIRNVIYQDLSYWRRRLLHRRAAEALLHQPAVEPANLAWHFEQAEDLNQAAHFALEAAERARGVFAHVEADQHYRRARALLNQAAAAEDSPSILSANRSMQLRVLEGLCWKARLLGDMSRYSDHLQEISLLAELIGDELVCAHLCWHQALVHRWFCRYKEAISVAEQGLKLSRAVGEAWCEAMCFRELGLSQRCLSEYAPAQEALQAALAGFSAAQDPLYETHTLGNLSTLFWMKGEPATAMDYARQALARCEVEGLVFERRLALGDMGAAAIALGEWELARSCLEESLEIARNISDRTQEIFCLGHLGWLELQTGQFTTALVNLETGLEMAETVGSLREQGWFYAGLAETYQQLDDLAGAEQAARRAMQLGEASHNPHILHIARHIQHTIRSADRSLDFP